MANTQSLIPPNIDYGKISADKYDPDGTYKKGDLRIQNNTLWKSKQNIDVPEPWTKSHWESTTLAAEFSALNSSKKWKLLGTAQGNGTGNGTSVNMSSILDTASEIMLIINYQYNKSGSRANFSAHVVPQGAFKQTYTGGFYFSASNYACLGVRITNENYAVIDGSWWHVQESASEAIPLDNDTATLYVYYR